MLRSSNKLPRLIGALQSSVSPFSTRSLLSSPLNLFVCAADASSDRVAAALVSSLKQQHSQGVKVYGVGGPALQSQGLYCVVSDEQYTQLATAEIIPPVHSYVTAKLPLPGVKLPSKSEYLKIFRDVIWEAALHGCSSRGKAARPTPATQQQLQQSEAVGGLPAEVSYDAVLSVGSPLAGQQLLFALRQAQKAKVARLPVIVHYMPPGLWDYAQVSSSAKTWSQLADHVMCSLPYEPAVLHAAGAPASFVGHPLLEPLLRGQFSNLRRQVAQALQLRAAGDNSSSNSSRGRAGLESLFTVGNAAAFWRDFERMATQPATRNIGSAVEDTTSSSNSSRSTAAVSSTRKRSASAPSAAAAAAAGSKQAKPLLLCLLPGSTESEICSSMPAFDHITKGLVQHHPTLAVAVIVPDILVEAAQEAVQNFSVPAVVAPEDFVLSTNALAAAAAAVAHPGSQSLRAVAAGVPLVCVRDGSLVRDGLLSWKNSKQLGFGCIPNQVLGYKAVPEVNLWARGGRELAVEAVGRLLIAAESAACMKGSGSSSNSNEWQQQREAFQEVLVRLVPPLLHQQTYAAVGSKGSRDAGAAAAAAAASVRAPGEAAAAALLELIALRKQQQEEQLQALMNSSSSSIGTR